MSRIKETIEFVVKVKIEYDEGNRKDAIKEAKRLMTSSSMGCGDYACLPKSAKLLKL
jgi:hypothetical protein